jgi:hypothetical protein
LGKQLTTLKLNAPLNIPDEQKKEFFRLLKLRNSSLKCLGLHKSFLRGYRPQPPQLSFMHQLGELERLEALTLYPLVVGSQSSELSIQETLSILDYLV